MIWVRSAVAAPDVFFTGPTSVVPVRITLGPEAIAHLARHPRDYVDGTAAVAGTTPSNAEVRLKGNGSFQPISAKPNFAIKFGGPGRRKVLLNGSAQDSSFLRWKLASEMFLKAGLPAARIGFARVELNGRNLGPYISVEPIDKEFLRHHFGSGAGNLYEGSNQDVGDPLELDSGNRSGDQNDLKPLAVACEERDLDKRWRLLEACLDVNRFSSFMALEVLMGHHDGYSLDRNNFRIYGDPASRRLVFLPHGMDLIFNNPTAPLIGRWRGLVAHAVMETRQGKARYREAVARVVKKVYTDDPWPRHIDEWAKLLRAGLGSGDTPESWGTAVAELKRQVEQRRMFALEAVARFD